jgi:hypothetical protein
MMSFVTLTAHCGVHSHDALVALGLGDQRVGKVVGVAHGLGLGLQVPPLQLDAIWLQGHSGQDSADHH